MVAPPQRKPRTPAQLAALEKARAAQQANGQKDGYAKQRAGASKRWENARAKAARELPGAPTIRGVDESRPAVKVAPPTPAVASADTTPAPPPPALQGSTPEGQPAQQPAEQPRRPTPLGDLRRLGQKVLGKKRE